MTTNEQERTAFEAWAEPGDFATDKFEDGAYIFLETRCAWQGWQARAQQPSAEPFGYFRAEPFGWTDCAETDEGAIALYARPAADVLADAVKKLGLLHPFLVGYELSEPCIRNKLGLEVRKWIDGLSELYGLVEDIIAARAKGGA